MTTKGLGFAGFAFGVVFASSVCAQGDVLYAARGDRLFRIDTATMVGVEVGATKLGSIAGLACAGDGTLYGIVSQKNVLIAIDPETASSVILGQVGVPIGSSSGLAWDPTAGELYAISSLGTGAASTLVRISPDTAQATVIADTAPQTLLGLGCDAEGTLYGLDGTLGKENLYRIDKATGATQLVVPGNLKPFPATGSLDFGPSGLIWTINTAGSSYELIEVDPATGFGTSHGLVQGLIGSQAFGGLASAPALGLTLYKPSPGVAGTFNTLMITGASPGGAVTVVYGFYPGSARVPFCKGKELVDIVEPFHLRTKKADEEGVVEIRFFVHEGLEGLPLLVQAIDFDSCETSNVIEVMF